MPMRLHVWTERFHFPGLILHGERIALFSLSLFIFFIGPSDLHSSSGELNKAERNGTTAKKCVRDIEFEAKGSTHFWSDH